MRRLQRAPNYLRAFGLAAPRLLLQVEREPPARGTGEHAYRVPGYEAPIHLRTIVSDHETFWQCIVERQYRLDLFPQWPEIERRMAAALARGLTPVIIDGGGNIGLAALWYARAFPNAVIVSIEPDAENFAMLEKNTAHLGPRVMRVYGAVVPEPMTVAIVNPEGGFSARRVAPAASGVEGFTIDELIARVPNAYPLIVKLDIEGFQARLFETNTGWVGRVDVITLELDDWQFPWGGTSNAFFRALAAHDFDYLLAQESIVCFRHEKAGGAATG